MYVPPQRLWLSETGRESEVDLLCIVDGRLILGEVKPRAKEFTPGDQARLCEVARALDPDIVTLACMEEESAALRAVREKIRLELHDLRCDVIVLAPKGRFVSGDSHLPQ